MLQQDLTPKQKQDPKYAARYDDVTGHIQLSNKQRSWMDSILFKHTGDLTATTAILPEHGMSLLLVSAQLPKA